VAPLRLNVEWRNDAGETVDDDTADLIMLAPGERWVPRIPAPNDDISDASISITRLRPISLDPSGITIKNVEASLSRSSSIQVTGIVRNNGDGKSYFAVKGKAYTNDRTIINSGVVGMGGINVANTSEFGSGEQFDFEFNINIPYRASQVQNVSIVATTSVIL
jgi:hypothetical protein